MERLRHSFLTYEARPDRADSVSIGAACGRQHARRVILTAVDDDDAEFASER